MSPRIPRSRVSHDRWLVSYADFITLLFAFFVVLFAFAKADQKKQAQVSMAIDDAFQSLGVVPDALRRPGSGLTAAARGDHQAILTDVVMREEVVSPTQVAYDLDQIRRELQQTLSNQIAQHTVSVQMGRDGLVISLREAGFFSSGSANPRQETLGTLHKIADSLRQMPYDVRVEGHTDNVPIHNVEFDSNWELSSARATRIARLFLNIHAVSPDRLSAAGYAEFHPIASNESVEGRAENRRVDLVVMPHTRIDLAARKTASPTGPWRRITDGE